MANIQINELVETTTVADSDWLAIDNGTATKKISAENFNAAAAGSAAQSAAAAAQSASDAADAKTAAEKAADDTSDLITSAQTIVSDAQTYANNASTSAGNASTSANTATAQAAIATNQANLAAGYATNVDAFAKEAKSWAVGGTGTRQGEDTDNSKYYSQAAHDSEINAAASESNAATSEANASSSESNASISATVASTNGLKAEGYAVGTQNGVPATSGETYYHDNAKYYKEQAASSETNAASSEYNAGLSESAAAASQTAAKESEDDSEAWAWGKIDGVDVPSTHPAYHNNAKYYADQASGGLTGVSSWNARSGNVVPAAHDYSANMVDFDNTNNDFVATNTQAAIEEVQGNVDTLDSSLASVAKSGSYSDLSSTPSLGTAAAKDSTNAVTQNSTDLIESGAVYTGLAAKADSSSLGTAAAKDSTNSITQSSTDLVESGAVYTGLASKADSSSLATVATSGAYSDLSGTPTIPDATTIDHTGTASSSGVRYQRIGIGSVYTAIDGTKYMEQSKTLSTSADVTYTFSNSAITTDSVIMPFASIFGIVPSSITVSSGTCSVVIPKYSSAVSCKIRIYIM